MADWTKRAEQAASVAKMATRKSWDNNRAIGNDGYPIWDEAYNKAQAEAEESAWAAAWDSIRATEA
jgi:hypothetical protein